MPKDKQQLNNQINQIDEILTKRKSYKISTYNQSPCHYKQMAFHKCQKSNRWVFGGNRTGKTECGAVETIWLCRGIHPFRNNKKDIKGWVVSLSTQVQRDVAQAKILSYLPKEWIKDIIMLSGKKTSPDYGIIDCIIIKNVFGGESIIGFKSIDQGREKFQGTSLDFVWFDEEPPYDIYLECKMRVVDRCGIIFGTMTPLKGITWVYNEIYLNDKQDDNIWYENMTWQDNPYLNQDEIRQLEASLSDDELASRRDGQFTMIKGLVYNEFDENYNVIDPFDVPRDWYDNISIDPGLKNPLSCHFYATDYDGNVYVIAEHYAAGLTVQQHAKYIKQIADSLNWPRRNNKLYSLIDSAAMQKTLASTKSVVELFYENDIVVNPNVNKDLFSGINKVKSYIKNALGERKLFIFKNCTNLIREIKGYFWGEEAPIKKDDHALDELRYYIMSKQTKQIKAKPSQLQLNKNKLIKRVMDENRRLWMRQ